MFKINITTHIQRNNKYEKSKNQNRQCNCKRQQVAHYSLLCGIDIDAQSGDRIVLIMSLFIIHKF